MTIGYIRVSTDKQNLENQKHKILTYAHEHKMFIDEFIELEITSKGDHKKRKIDEIFTKLKRDDVLILTELSRLGRNMLEILNLIERFNSEGIKLIFINQPELSTNQNSALSSLLLAIYGYFAQTEREIISERTKQGLEMARKSGKKLGRPVGILPSELDEHTIKIKQYVKEKIPITTITKLLNQEHGKKFKSHSVRYFCKVHKIIK